MSYTDIKITKSQYEQAIRDKDDADYVIDAYLKQKLEDFDERLASGRPFTDDELVYVAYTLCPCGHGLAYPQGMRNVALLGLLRYFEANSR